MSFLVGPMRFEAYAIVAAQSLLESRVSQCKGTGRAVIERSRPGRRLYAARWRIFPDTSAPC